MNVVSIMFTVFRAYNHRIVFAEWSNGVELQGFIAPEESFHC